MTILLAALLTPAFVFQRTLIAHTLEEDGSTFALFEARVDWLIAGRTLNNPVAVIKFTLIQTDLARWLRGCRSNKIYTILL